MASSRGLRYTVPNSSKEEVMIAMLVAPEHMTHVVVCDGGRIDFGQTCASIMGTMADNEIAVALGCYDMSLEKEIYLATSESLSKGHLSRCPCKRTSIARHCTSLLRKVLGKPGRESLPTFVWLHNCVREIDTCSLSFA